MNGTDVCRTEVKAYQGETLCCRRSYLIVVTVVVVSVAAVSKSGERQIIHRNEARKSEGLYHGTTHGVIPAGGTHCPGASDGTNHIVKASPQRRSDEAKGGLAQEFDGITVLIRHWSHDCNVQPPQPC